MLLKRVASAACLIALLIGVLWGTERSASAQSSTRLSKLKVPFTEYEWWLIDWQTNQVLCRFFTDHAGMPTLGDVAVSCGQELANAWFVTPPCKNLLNCKGLYVFLVATQATEREIEIELPPAVVWVSLDGCAPQPPENLCTILPALVLTGEEPIPGYAITAINGSYDGEAFRCEGADCKIQLRPTPLQGVHIEFWADSSYGDSSEHFSAEVRVIDTGVTAAPGASGWYVDVISSQWTGEPLASCARIWEAFPPVGTPPTWLTTPDSFQLLASDEPYYYLAGRLISQGIVDASYCFSGGLQPNGYADACGLEVARPLVQTWQKQFDTRIREVAGETGVPAQLMKNLFAQESQFWPGVFRVPYEFGLGQLTDRGVDSILLWNPDFYAQFCPLVLSEDTCALGYLKIPDEDRAILRGALALQARSDCEDCPTGVDLSNVNFSVKLFANTLQANCAQVARTIYTATGSMAGRVSTYEDLWRFTIANYHAGPGCVAFAIHQAWDARSADELTWDTASAFFTEACQSAVPYVEQITK
jgi:hypothetical protein